MKKILKYYKENPGEFVLTILLILGGITGIRLLFLFASIGL